MAGIITYFVTNEGWTAARKNSVFYYPVLLFDQIGKDGDFTGPLKFEIVKDEHASILDGFHPISHLKVDQDLKKRWRKLIAQVEKGQTPVREQKDILLSIQKYYFFYANVRDTGHKRRSLARFIVYPQPKEKVIARMIEMLRVRDDRGAPFVGDVVKLWVPTGNTYSFLFETEMPYDGCGPAIYKLTDMAVGTEIKTYQKNDWA
jgi:hypothetical protein